MDPRLLRTLRYHLGRIGESEDPGHDWRRVEQCADELLAQPAREDELLLRRLLAELRTAARERRFHESQAQLERELERVLEAAGARGEAGGASRPAVEQVAELLRGKAVLVVGGIPRPEHAAKLRASFQLGQVYWPETSEKSPSLAPLEPYVARADVALVLLLIRWSRHAFGEIAELCRRHGKPLVYLPAGYNEQQIAQQVLAQRGGRLRETP